MPRIITSKMNIEERDVLHKLYITKGWAASDIAEKLGLSTRTTFDLLKLHGISRDNKYKAPKYCDDCGHMATKKKRRQSAN